MKWKWKFKKDDIELKAAPAELLEKIEKYGGQRFIVLKDHGMFLMRHKKGAKTIESELFKSQNDAAEDLLEKLKSEYGEGNE